MQTKAVIEGVRFSYVTVFEPKAIQPGQDPKRSISILIDKSDKKTLNILKSAIEAAIKEGLSKWGGKKPPNLKTPIRDGDVERPDQEEYAGKLFFNASTKNPVPVVDANMQNIINPDEFYSGCYGRVSVNFYAFSVNGNKGIAAGLNACQKLRDGERLGGVTVNVEQEFGAFEDDSDDNDPLSF